MSETAELVLELRNDVSEIARLAQAVDTFCEEQHLPPRAAFHFNLVLEEIVTNVINYAFTDAGPHPIHVRLAREAGKVRGEVRDGGKAFDPLALPPPRLDLDIEQRQVGGLGVYFLKTLMDDVAYRRMNGQNCLQFAKTVE
jgi:anti-sigma regulatory factor (Ser/Thr protein kinase)